MASEKIWVDYYAVLGVSPEATAKEIASAYRRRALECHPDKNADNPAAISEFHSLTRAYQLLIDESARKALDTVLAGRKARKERDASLDLKRKSMRDDLLRREEQVKRRKAEEAEAEEGLQREIERLRKESAAAEAKEKEFHAEEEPKPLFDELDRTLKFKLARPMTAEDIQSIFGEYGKVESLVLGKKETSGVVQLNNILTAKALIMDVDRGLVPSVTLAEWAKGSPPNIYRTGTTVNAQDFESITLMRMRQRAERAKEIARLQMEEQGQKTDHRASANGTG